MAVRHQSEHVLDFPLVPVGRVDPRGEGAERGAVGPHRTFHLHDDAEVDERMQGEYTVGGAAVGGVQADQPPASSMQIGHEIGESLRIDGHVHRAIIAFLPDRESGGGIPDDLLDVNAHSNPPVKSEAMRSSASSSTPGMYRPRTMTAPSRTAISTGRQRPTSPCSTSGPAFPNSVLPA